MSMHHSEILGLLKYDANMLHWQYKGEGNKHIVVKNEQSQKVYRLLKKEKVHKKKFKVDYDSVKEDIQLTLSFVQHVMSPNFNSRFLPSMKVIDLPPGVAGQIRDDTEPLRPEQRRNKELDTDCPYATVMADACHVCDLSQDNRCSSSSRTTFAVEIKPKWGFLPTTEKIAEETKVKRRVCRYCMHQHLKVSRGMWKRRSAYCPIDLFSGDVTRMKHALLRLMDEPQNNVRLFKNGEVIWNDRLKDNTNSANSYIKEFSGTDNQTQSPGLFDSFLDLVVKCLLYTPDTTKSPVNLQSGQTCEGSTYECQRIDAEVKGAALPQGCVLDQLLRVQLMDDLDIEGVHPLYKRLVSPMGGDSQGSKDFKLKGPFDEHWASLPRDHDDNSLQYSASQVKRYLVSRSAKDCSLMVAIEMTDASSDGKPDGNPPKQAPSERVIMDKRTPSPSRDLDEDSGLVIADDAGIAHRFSVSVLDLDVKSPDKIPFYLREDKEVVEYYLNTIQAKAAEPGGAE